MLSLNRICFSYGTVPVVTDLDVRIAAGEMVAFLGANGAGKTTILRLAAGLLRPDGGWIGLDDRDLRKWSSRSLAQRVAYLPQEAVPAFAFPVALVVELGRAQYQRGLRGPSAEDWRAIRQALTDTGTGDLADRMFTEVSGGERRRVLLAMALAQQPRMLLLDEPTVHLDLRFQVEILTLLRNLNRTHGLTIVAAMHDLNLASLFFDRLLLLRDGRLLDDGSPQQVLTAENIATAYGAEVIVLAHPAAGRPQVLTADGKK